ncbi:hypothetical protein C0V73_19185 [Rhizobium sp. TH135]|uniref:type II toxin-antitoxin system RelE/ParE family toxin n=1 Tax=Rhizobium sp. TH135 TaxID=2067451 RepID=UPI000C7DAC76|nr:type II toxin-antitoxin system RelE/ParE family toxin [Rhizobium sp. TH135]PLK69625.1 hypothetical protein C0V73_19185 [Rhizobium sp. TH135]
MISIRLSRKAADYVRRESTYFRERSPSAAKAFVQSMKRARTLLQDFPHAGNTMHGLQIAGFRTLVVGEYLLDYRLRDAVIEIVAIRHGRMQIAMPEIDDPDTLADK